MPKMTRDDLPWPAKELADAMWGIDTTHREGGRDFVSEHFEAVEQFLRQHPTTFHGAYEVLLKIPEDNRLQSGFTSDLAGALFVLGHEAMNEGPMFDQQCQVFRQALTHWSTLIRDEAQSQISWVSDFDAIPLLDERSSHDGQRASTYTRGDAGRCGSHSGGS